VVSGAGANGTVGTSAALISWPPQIAQATRPATASVINIATM
jgi:hypothetical protein